MTENKKYGFQLDNDTGLCQIFPMRRITIKQLDHHVVFPKKENKCDGGLIYSLSTLPQYGNSWVFKNSVVDGIRSVILGDAVVCGGSLVLNSMIMDDAEIYGSYVNNSVVCRDAVVRRVHLKNAVIGPDALIESYDDYRVIKRPQSYYAVDFTIYHTKYDTYKLGISAGSPSFKSINLIWLRIDDDGIFDEQMKKSYNDDNLLSIIHNSVSDMKRNRKNINEIDTNRLALNDFLTNALSEMYRIQTIK